MNHIHKISDPGTAGREPSLQTRSRWSSVLLLERSLIAQCSCVVLLHSLMAVLSCNRIAQLSSKPASGMGHSMPVFFCSHVSRFMTLDWLENSSEVVRRVSLVFRTSCLASVPWRKHIAGPAPCRGNQITRFMLPTVLVDCLVQASHLSWNVGVLLLRWRGWP